MKLYALVLGLALCAIPACADSIGISGGSYFADYQPPPLCCSGPTVEDFSTSFVYDTLGHQVSDMSFTATGLLGNFSFSYVAPNSTPTFFWQSPLAIIDMWFPASDVPAAADPGHEIEGTKAFQIICTTVECSNDFGPSGYQIYDSHSLAEATYLGPSDPSPVPESSSLILLSAGLVGAFMLRRKSWIGYCR